jgi:bifunctional non-homologous end joining protein LigD
MKKPTVSSKKKSLKKHAFEITHPDKIMYPKSKITKQEVIDYYREIAPYFLQHSKNRLMVMQRFPLGIHKVAFFQKQIPTYFPKWIKRKAITLSTGEKQSLVVLDTPDSLVFLANEGVLVFHPWLSSTKALNKPNKIVFDLDPSGPDIRKVKRAARLLKKILEGHNLVPFIMTTGSKGFHIAAPIIPEHSFEKIRAFTRHIAQELAAEYPKDFTVEIRKAKRKGRVFIDYLRNSFGQTSVAPYSLRAKEGAPVATPIEWKELATTSPQKYTMKNIFKRLARKGDAWQDFEEHAKKLKLDI